ncbi:MAG TPA: type II toxin-antitoxin system HicB family antitoxin [Candidatus Baltobacteraceae bacterium]|nr:type II toxin-antitoxin system HicB family antitoxin [Candidatus Baltobacteraceae bacterium]
MRAEVAGIDYRYVVILEPEDGAFNVVVPALPEVATFGKSVEDARLMARDAITLALEYRRSRGIEIPPSDESTARVETISISLPAA